MIMCHPAAVHVLLSVALMAGPLLPGAARAAGPEPPPAIRAVLDRGHEAIAGRSSVLRELAVPAGHPYVGRFPRSGYATAAELTGGPAALADETFRLRNRPLGRASLLLNHLLEGDGLRLGDLLALDALESVALGAGKLTTGWVSQAIQNRRFLKTVAPSLLRVSTTSAEVLADTVGVAVGGLVAIALLEYGGYFLGLHDLQTANKSAAAGAVGLAAGAAAAWGTLGLVGAYGTASTGTAIAGLSGAAASNATLAALGGGSLAAGGTGAAGGAVVLTGGAAVVALAIAAGVKVGWDKWDAADQRQYVRDTLNRLLDAEHLVTPERAMLFAPRR